MLGGQPQQGDDYGQPRGFGGMSNSLIGLGMGMLQPYRPGLESPWTNALQGYQTGSALDQRTAQQQQQMAIERARLKLAQETAGREPEAIRQLRAAGVPQEKWADYLYPKQDEWKTGSVNYREQDYPYRINPRTGQTEWGIMGAPPGAGAARPAAPQTVVPGTTLYWPGQGQQGAAAPSTTGAGGAPAAAPGAIPPPLPGIEEELPSVQKKVREQQLTDYAKTQLKDPQAEAAAKQTASNVLSALDTAEKLATNQGGLLPTTGIVGGALSQVYQPSKDLATTLDTIKANVSLDKLTAMRAASPTGASGLGAVTEGEHRLLQASIAALDQSQSPTQFRANLARVRATYEWIVNRTDKNQPAPFTMRPSAAPTTESGGPFGTGGGLGGTTKSGIKWTVQ